VLGLAAVDTAAVITAAATVVLAAVAAWQIRAGQKQSEATLEAAERQWQPVVIVHQWHGGPVRGSGEDAAPDEMAVRYFLGNEGVGPALNVEHGVEVSGTRHVWPLPPYAAHRAGEYVPAID
jgi:hypothetical protein